MGFESGTRWKLVSSHFGLESGSDLKGNVVLVVPHGRSGRGEGNSWWTRVEKDKVKGYPSTNSVIVKRRIC